MSREALNNLLAYLRETLSYDNRKWLSERLVEPERDAFRQMTMEEIDRRIDQAEADIAAGNVISNDDMMVLINDFVKEAKKTV